MVNAIIITMVKFSGSGHIIFQYPNKREMIMRGNGEVVIEDQSDSDEMLKLEDASDGDGI